MRIQKFSSKKVDPKQLHDREQSLAAYWLRWGSSDGRLGSSGVDLRCSSSLVQGRRPSRPADSPTRSAPSCCTTQNLHSLGAIFRSSRGPGLMLVSDKKERKVFITWYVHGPDGAAVVGPEPLCAVCPLFLCICGSPASSRTVTHLE